MLRPSSTSLGKFKVMTLEGGVSHTELRLGRAWRPEWRVS